MKTIINIISMYLFAVSMTAIAAHHEDHAWILSAEESKVSYGSIKNSTIGEVNHFKTVAGNISSDGKVEVSIDLTSVETNIEIRNKRMLKHIFDIASPQAKLTADIDINEIKSLPVGGTTLIDTVGILAVLDNEIEIETAFFVARLDKNRFVAVTDEMVMLKAATLGVDAGIDILKELAQLNSITRVAPVNLRLVFEKNNRKEQS